MLNGSEKITDIVERHPQTIEIFQKYGMHCFGCMAARFENLEQGALAHGINVENLLKDLNTAVAKH